MGKFLCCLLIYMQDQQLMGTRSTEKSVYGFATVYVQPTKAQFWGSALKCIKNFLEHIIGSCLRKFRDDRSCLVWLHKDKSLHLRWYYIFLSLTTQEIVVQCLQLAGKGNAAQGTIKRSKVTNVSSNRRSLRWSQIYTTQLVKAEWLKWLMAWREWVKCKYWRKYFGCCEREWTLLLVPNWAM